MYASHEVDRVEIEKLYRAVADREPTLELLRMIHDLFGESFNLRPPRLRDAAGRCLRRQARLT